MPNSDPELVQAYLRWFSNRRDEDLWACEAVNARVAHAANPPDAWALVVALVAAADDDSLEFVGAGPLEDFVRNFGSSYIDTIEAAARADSKFSRCLGRVWLTQGDVPPDVLVRVVEASQGRIRPFPNARA
jgi:hypothetical protein